LKLLLDEMYPGALARALRQAGIDVATVAELALAGSSDPEVFADMVTDGYTLLTENVADFTRISAERLHRGQHHPGVLIALSSRFSRRPAGANAIVTAIREVGGQELEDRLVYLKELTQGCQSG
jgi:predicted nuclease of predicted toxin-antitoxin system